MLQQKDDTQVGLAAAAADGDSALLEQLVANERLAGLGRLATSMVHELNTPLSVIASAAQMILREESLSDPVRELVERIGDESRRLAQLSRGLLTFSRQDADRQEAADVNAVLAEVLAFLHYEGSRRGVEVREELDHQLPPVAADANRLKQVFINLLLNALQAMPDGGLLTVRSSRTVGDQVLVSIADTGCGIPPRLLTEIFKPFFTTKPSGEGTGLGLYVCHSIVSALGGKLSVTSEPGRGTIFSLTLQLAPESP